MRDPVVTFLPSIFDSEVFEHEHAQKTTKGGGNQRLKHPRVAVVLSGTRNQYAPLVESLYNGLKSRFGTYRFSAPLAFVSQRPTPRDTAFEQYQEKATKTVTDLWRALSERPYEAEGRRRPLYFDVSQPLWERMDAGFRALFEHLFHAQKPAPGVLAASIYRGVLIAFRIAMVLCVLRRHEERGDLRSAHSIEAGDVDAALALGLVYVEHSIRQAYEMAPALGLLPDMEDVGGKDRMTGQQRQLWDELGEAFTTADVTAWQEKHGEPARSTLFEWLNVWQEAGLVEKLSRGKYRKATASDLSDFPDFPPKHAENDDFGSDFESD